MLNTHELRAEYRLIRQRDGLVPNRLARGFWCSLAAIVGMVLVAVLLLFLMTGWVWAGNAEISGKIEGYSLEQWADAIYSAEGGSKTRHPYGILTKYKHTSPRQACINTIINKHKVWVKAGKPGQYIDYLANKYAPLNVANDPSGLNRHWRKNVQYFLARNK